MWRRHGLEDERQNNNVNDLASLPSLLPESSWIYQKAKVRMAMREDLLEGEVALFCALRKMREERDRAWKDMFEKNPDKRGEDLWRRVEERLKNKQNWKNRGREV
jgi:hypothetical protein